MSFIRAWAMFTTISGWRLVFGGGVSTIPVTVTVDCRSSRSVLPIGSAVPK